MPVPEACPALPLFVTDVPSRPPAPFESLEDAEPVMPALVDAAEPPALFVLPGVPEAAGEVARVGCAVTLSGVKACCSRYAASLARLLRR